MTALFPQNFVCFSPAIKTNRAWVSENEPGEPGGLKLRQTEVGGAVRGWNQSSRNRRRFARCCSYSCVQPGTWNKIPNPWSEGHNLVPVHVRRRMQPVRRESSRAALSSSWCRCLRVLLSCQVGSTSGKSTVWCSHFHSIKLLWPNETESDGVHVA